MQRAKHATSDVHDVVSIPEFALLMGWTPRDTRVWLASWSARLGLHIGARTVPRTVLEIARGMETGRSGFHAQARLEAYLKEQPDARARPDRAAPPRPPEPRASA